ncbi:metal-dependent transcriptional regulator [Halanaeroarchaeum sulfurireducens]|uniref:Iron dependent repressor n=1 Tax=Halanaeroarchaeum sulfurireducens TaxID=1604004 RepID=A0A0F7PAC5_9EURY|nr:metal-dependent transcriptional regulator [Halanaeroarchaeum sulfurireducens]AKH96574.1 iron dependent repressor [Halanaeroarchaeum sulfurireducens]ALG80976.1 iron dependent repressor [Halanaeroarchaeum sulfurireducens]
MTSREQRSTRTLPNRNAGNYLRTILTESESRSTEIRPGRLSDVLGVTPPSVSQMLEKLEDTGYANHKPYGGITLTDKGEQIARHLQWRTCVFEAFFSSHFDVELTDTQSYRASFELPDSLLVSMSECLDMPCRHECDDRVWPGDCPDCDGVTA